jgi:tetratricopeptide (TPR) repeat protein
MSSTSDANAQQRRAKAAADMKAAMEHHHAGRLNRAEALYRKALDKAPDHPDALHMLGVIATARGRPERAIQLIGKMLQIVPDFPDAHLNLGNALRVAGKPEQAIASYQRAIALRPDYAMAYSNLARVMNDTGQYAAALPSCYAAVGINPRLLPARINLTNALRGLGRLDDAAKAWRDAIALDPGQPESHHKLGLLLVELKRFDEAISCHDRSIALQPDNAVFHCARGSALSGKHDAAAAAESFRRAADLRPDFVEAWIGLGWALRLIGRFDEADACFERLHELDPTHIGNYRHVAAHGQGKDEARDMQRLAEVTERPESGVDERIAAGFGLGRLLDTAGRFDEAFARYAAANALVRENWPAKADHFDIASFTRLVDLLIATHTAEYFADLIATGNPSELPVFVVGMPRSGTTLVEQICASHSRVFGAGELHNIHQIASAMAGQRGGPAREADVDDGRRLADAHIEWLRSLGEGASRVVDKMPDNILQVGLIATLFPRAQIIYCSRDARDISLSCYFQLFADGLMPFAYDLVECGTRCREVQRLAAHWLHVLPDRVMEVNYESLVGDLEGEGRRLIEFLGLPWEPACLDFHRTERTVTTVSHWQVRQPLYHSSVARWRNYERHLGPLFDALRGPKEMIS